MAKIYTAQEMRRVSDLFGISEPIESILRETSFRDISAMLRQSANALEREEKREKKYEHNVDIEGDDFFFESLEDAERLANALKDKFKVIISRREVGEWEEVSSIV